MGRGEREGEREGDTEERKGKLREIETEEDRQGGRTGEEGGRDVENDA